MNSLIASTQNLEKRHQLQWKPSTSDDLTIQSAGGASVNLAGTLRESLLSGWICPYPEASSLSETSGVQITLGGAAKINQYPFAFGAIVNVIELQIHVHSFAARDSSGYLSNSLTWLAFTREALKDSRPMTDWERKAAAEFFWSEFD